MTVVSVQVVYQSMKLIAIRIVPVIVLVRRFMMTVVYAQVDYQIMKLTVTRIVMRIVLVML